MYEFNDDGPVFGPTGQWELDPDIEQCNLKSWRGLRPVFATCKNNCPGGESAVISSETSRKNYTFQFSPPNY